MNAMSLAPFPSNPCLCRSELSEGLKNLGTARGRGKQNRFTFASLRELFGAFHQHRVDGLGVPPFIAQDRAEISLAVPPRLPEFAKVDRARRSRSTYVYV